MTCKQTVVVVVDLRFRWLGQKGHSEGEVVLVRVFHFGATYLFFVVTLLDTLLFASSHCFSSSSN